MGHQRPRALPEPGWSVFDAFAVPRIERQIPTWEPLNALRAHAVAVAGASHAELVATLQRWDLELEALGGDPSFGDWAAFRPLRLSREEDWSDWLGHLVARSQHGFLARELVGDADARALAVEREVTTDEGYRADLVILWSGDRASHIEVKIGDMAFDKTFGTALALRRLHPHTPTWTDFILLPSDDVAEWDRVAATASPTDPRIAALTWADLAVALRRELRAAREAIDWRVWAAAFAGAIEQTLLGLPQRSRAATRAPRFDELLLAARHLDLLRRAEATDG